MNTQELWKRAVLHLLLESKPCEQEFLEILIDLMVERLRTATGLAQQRKLAKRAALATDLGLNDNLGD